MGERFHFVGMIVGVCVHRLSHSGKFQMRQIRRTVQEPTQQEIAHTGLDYDKL